MDKDNQYEKFRQYAKEIRENVPVQKNKIVFSQFGGNGYGCHPKAIADEIIKREYDWDLAWILKKGTNVNRADLPKEIRPVVSKEGGKNCIYELETAKVWINNIHFADLIDRGLEKRPETVYVNTFHGGICLKKEGSDRPNFEQKMKKPSRRAQMHMLDNEMVDYLISASDAGDDILNKFFMNHGKILRFGDARNDVIINGDPQIVKKVHSFFKIPMDTKIFMYAPTFRDDADISCYDIDYEGILDALEAKYGCKWVALSKMHPNMLKKASEIIPKSKRILNATAYVDMQELLVATDIMATDYSSGIADFMLSRKPGFMFTPDLENYMSTRGLYFPIEDMPFPIAKSNEELIAAIDTFDEAKYKKDVQSFLDKIHYIDDGKAAERIVDFLATIINPHVPMKVRLKRRFKRTYRFYCKIMKKIRGK